MFYFILSVGFICYFLFTAFDLAISSLCSIFFSRKKIIILFAWMVYAEMLEILNESIQIRFNKFIFQFIFYSKNNFPTSILLT